MSYYDVDTTHHEFVTYGAYPQKHTVHIRWLIISACMFVLLGISTIVGKTLAGVQQDTISLSVVQGSMTSGPEPGTVSAAASVAENRSAELEAKLAAWAEGKTSDWGFYVHALEGGELQAGYREDEQFDMASIYKLFLIRPLAQKIPAEAWAMTNITERSYLACVQAMLAVSDNPCSEAIAGRLGWSAAQKQLVSDGYKQTLLNRTDKFVSSAADTGLLLDRLYNGDGYDAKTREIALDALGRPKHTEAIRKACIGCTVYNKTGDIGTAKHDAAIVQKDGKAYVVVIFSKDATWPLMTEAAQLIIGNL